MQEIKRDVYARIGGCCYTLNVFMRELLRALGLETYYARCNIHGSLPEAKTNDQTNPKPKQKQKQKMQMQKKTQKKNAKKH